MYNHFFDRLRDLFAINKALRKDVEYIGLIIEEMENDFLEKEEKTLELVGSVTELCFTVASR